MTCPRCAIQAYVFGEMGALDLVRNAVGFSWKQGMHYPTPPVRLFLVVSTGNFSALVRLSHVLSPCSKSARPFAPGS